jgi:hypothetical protein
MIKAIIDVFGWTSFALNVFVLLLYLLDRPTGMFPASIYICSIVACVIQDIGFVFPFFADQNKYCTTQAFLLHYGLSAWHISVFLMALWLFLILNNNNTLKVKRRLILLHYCAIFLIPLIPCLAVLLTVSSVSILKANKFTN